VSELEGQRWRLENNGRIPFLSAATRVYMNKMGRGENK